MDMELNQTQRAIEASLSRLLDRRAGPDRARGLRKADDVDRLLMIDLNEAGFLDLFHDAETGPLMAMLVTEWSATAAALAPIGARVLSAASVMGERLPLVIAVGERSQLKAVRYAAQADALILIDGDEAGVASRGQFEATPVRTKFGYPMARVGDHAVTPLAPGAGAVVRRWHRV